MRAWWLLLCAAGCSDSGPHASKLLASQTGELVRGSITAMQLTPGDDAFGPGDVLDSADLELAASPGLTLQQTRATAREIDVLVAIDASAPLGPVDLEVRVGTEPARFRANAAFSIVDGGGVTELADALDVDVPEGGSTVVWLAPGAPDHVIIDASGATGAPVLAVLDADGRFAPDLASRSHREVVVDVPRAVVVRDRDGHAGTFHLTTDRIPLHAVPAVGGTTTLASAQLTGAPDVLVTNAVFAGADDVHYYAVDLDVSVVGMQLTAATTGDDDVVDTRVSVISDDQASLVGFPSADHGALDAVTTPTIAADGRYYVRVSPGSRFTPDHATYSLAMVLR